MRGQVGPEYLLGAPLAEKLLPNHVETRLLYFVNLPPEHGCLFEFLVYLALDGVVVKGVEEELELFDFCLAGPIPELEVYFCCGEPNLKGHIDPLLDQFEGEILERSRKSEGEYLVYLLVKGDVLGDCEAVGDLAFGPPVFFRQDLVEDSEVAVKHLQGRDVLVARRLYDLDGVQRRYVDPGRAAFEVDLEPVYLGLGRGQVQEPVVADVV